MLPSRLVRASRLCTVVCLVTFAAIFSILPARSNNSEIENAANALHTKIDQNLGSLRIPRPSTTFQFHESFTVKRETAVSGNFERWRRDYCCPPVCAMVLCHGACIDTADHCPSFAEVNLVLNRVNACSMGDGGSGGGTKPSARGCCE